MAIWKSILWLTFVAKHVERLCIVSNIIPIVCCNLYFPTIYILQISVLCGTHIPMSHFFSLYFLSPCFRISFPILFPEYLNPIFLQLAPSLGAFWTKYIFLPHMSPLKSVVILEMTQFGCVGIPCVNKRQHKSSHTLSLLQFGLTKKLWVVILWVETYICWLTLALQSMLQTWLSVLMSVSRLMPDVSSLKDTRL